jgi:hypothetical protein
MVGFSVTLKIRKLVLLTRTKIVGNEITFVFYIGTCVLCLYGVLLFGWWLIKSRLNVSPMFIYIMALLGLIGFRTALDAIAFYDRVFDPDPSVWLFDHWLWPFRIMLIFGIVGIIVGHMSYRAFYQRRRQDGSHPKD